MQLSTTTKYAFRIRTRSGAVVDNLSFAGKDEPDAERKLRQIYMGCEILEVKLLVSQPARGGPMSYEDVVDLLSEQPLSGTTK
jgi:hypothetical protein